MDMIYSRSFLVDNLAADCFGRLKPSMLLYYAQEIAGEHARLLGAGREDLDREGVFWAVIRTRVEISRLPQIGEEITLETWPMPTTRVAYPRAMRGVDREGQELFRLLSLWVLMDKDSRAMVLPGKSNIRVPGIVRDLEPPTPGSLAVHEFSNIQSRSVTYSMLDINGHMNNTRYLDWAADLLPASFHREHFPRQITLCYLSEALEGQQADIQWELSEGGLLQVDAHRRRTDDHSKKDRIFAAQIQF